MGIFLITTLQAYSTYYIEPKRTSSTYEKMERIKIAIASFVNVQKRYPCPSNPALDTSDPNFGLEDCTLANAVNAIGTCHGGACKVAGARVTPASTAPNPDFVLIGAVPYKTILCGGYACTSTNASDFGIPFAMDDIQDGWGTQMTYAVSGYQVMSATFDSSFGTIGIQKEDGGSLIHPTNGAHYAIISHGLRGTGGYTINGRIKKPCASGSALEMQNCDGDAFFLNGLKRMSDEATFFSDIVTFQTYTLSSLWDYSTVATHENDVYNLNGGNVGIGIAAPAERLDVNGAIKGLTLKTNTICDIVGTNCFDPSVLGGPTGSVCTAPSGHISLVTGIQNNTVGCSAAIPLPVVLAGQSCALGSYAVGINSLGQIICRAP